MTVPADLPRLPARRPDAHKGTFGTVLVFAGSRGMTGAAVLAGAAALRGGAGLVRVACPADVLPIVAAGNPCYTTAPVPHHADGTFSEASADELLRLAADATVVAAGPGLGNRPDVGHVVRRLLAERPDQPVVLDADGLNVIAGDDDPFAGRRAPAVLTPHPGEFGRLLGIPTAAVQKNRERLAIDFAARHRVIVLLKGADTVVTDGSRAAVNPTGNPGMATGGCGDVLTGLVAALLAHGLAPFDAAVLGAWAHGRAGDRAAAALSQAALTAADLLDYLPPTFLELEAGK